MRWTLLCKLSIIRTLSVAVFAFSSTARAAVVVPVADEELAKQADRIVLGDVLAANSRWNRNNTLIVTDVTLRAGLTLKGDDRGIETIEIIGGTVGELSLRASDMPVLVAGDSVLLFLNSDDTIVGSFQGAYYTDGVTAGRSEPGVYGVDVSNIKPLRELVDTIARVLNADPPRDEELHVVGGAMPSNDRYEIIGADWSYKNEPMGEDFLINPNCADASAGPIQNQISAIFLGSSAWTDAGAEFEFSFGGITASTSDTFNGENIIFFCPAGNCGMANSTLAVTHIWFAGNDILEWDMIFNDANHQFWDGQTGACGGTRYDIQAVSAHEFGHALGLDHSQANDATMWLSIPACELGPRTLAFDDIDGLNSLYGEAGTPFYFVGATDEDRLGFAVSNAGDVNNDGIEDIILGAPYNDDNGTNAGKIYLYSGDTGLLIDTIVGGNDGYQFGYAVGFAGDVNGDGQDDFIVGAPYASNSRGRAYVYSGSDRSLIYARSGTSGETERFGFSVAGNLDVDADGYSDFICSSPYSDESGSNAGKVRVYSGRDGAMLIELFGERKKDNFGWVVCKVGRINGDDNDDFLVGAPNNDDAGSNRGKAYIYSGRHLALLYSLTGYQNGSQFGRGASIIGIIDNDDRDEFTVASPYYDRDDRRKAGRMDVFSGKTGSKLYSKKGEVAEDRLGWSMSPAGDLDDDGVDDVIIGSPRNSSLENTQGRVYIRNGLSGALIAQFDGDEPGDQLGVSVSGINDINGDGLNDVVMGAPYNDLGGSKAGRAYVSFSDDHVALRAIDGDPLLDDALTDAHRDRVELYRLVSAWMEGGLLADLNDDGLVDEADFILITQGRRP